MIAEKISERLLRPRDYLVVERFQSQGNVDSPSGHKITIRSGDAFVFQVQAVERILKWEPLPLYNSSGTLKTALTPGTGYTYGRLYDSNGDDILRVNDSAWTIYHWSIAVQQPDIRIYPQIPPNELSGGWEYLVAGQPAPDQGDNYGYVAGREISDYFDPPAKLESLGWRGKDRSSTLSYNYYGYYNESKVKTIIPLLNVTGRTYLVAPVMDDLTKRQIVAGPPEGPARTIVFLGTTRKQYDLPTPTDWDNANCSIPIGGAKTPQQLVEGY